MAKNNDIDIELLAGLSEDTYSQIVNDIKDIQKRLEASGVKLKIDLNADDIMKKVASTENISAMKKTGVNLSKALIEQFGIVDKSAKEKIKSLSAELKNIRIGEIKTGTGNDALTTTMRELSNVVLNNANIIKERLGIYDKFYDYLKKLGNIKISDALKADLGDDWKTLRLLYPSKFSLKSGIEMDSVYQELSTKFKDIFSGTSHPADQFRELTTAIKNYRADVTQIKPIEASDLLEDSIYEVMIGELSRIRAAVKSTDVSDSTKAITGEAQSMDEVATVAKKASKEKENFAEANRDVARSAEDTAEAVDRERDAMMDMNDLDSILAGINLHGQQGANIFDSLGDSFRNTFSAYTAANLLERTLDEIVDAGKEAVEKIKELDDINVDLQMATGKDKNYVKGLIADYSELGQELGALTSSVAESADIFLRQGRSMEETNQLIKDAVVLSKVAQTEGEEASEILTATINGFQLAATEGSRVNDILSSIDLNSASSAQGIGTALTKVASMANSAGLSLEKTAAFAAVLKETTMDADETIGVSMKTILSRMNQIRAGKFVDEETGEALNDVEAVLNKIGITMRDEFTGQFKEAEVIIDEIGKKWASFDENSKKAAQFALGGSYQANKVVALFDNYQKVIELTRVAEESEGTALQKFNDSYLGSLEAKTSALKASLESLASVTISDELYADILDVSKGLVDAAADTGILKSALVGLGTAGSLYGIQQLVGLARNAAQGFANLSAAMDITRAGNISVDSMQRLIDLTGGLSQSQTRLVLSSRNLTDAQRVAILMNRGLSQAEAQAQIQAWGLASAQNGAARATVTLSSSLKGLAMSMISQPWILVTVGVTALVSAFTKYKQSVEEAKQATKEAAEEASTLTNELSDLTSKYLELSEAVKTDESAKKSLMGTQEELLKKLNLEGENVDALVEKYGSLSNAINQVTLDTLKQAQIDLIAGLDTARKELLDVGKDKFFGINNSINATGDDSIKAFQELEKAGVINKGSYGSGGGSINLTGDDTTVEGVLQNYQKLEDALKALRDSDAFTAQELSENPLYKKLYDRWNEMRDEVEAYEDAISNLNSNLAQQTMLSALQGAELPDTQVEFEKFRQELVDTAIASKQFIGTEEQIESAINSYLASVPQFAGYFSVPLEEELNTVEDLTKKIYNAFDVEAFNDTLKSIDSGYKALISAKQEFEDNGGFLSPTTIAELTESGLIQYLEQTEDGIRFNTEAFLENAEAIKENAVQQLYSAMCHDIEAIAIGNVDSVSQQAKTALESAGLMSEEAGNQATEASAKWWELGASISSVLAAMNINEGGLADDIIAQIEAVRDYYAGIANGVWNSQPTGKSGSGSSSTKDPYVEDFEKEHKSLKHKLAMDLISEQEYYDELEELNNQYFKGKKEYEDQYNQYLEEIYDYRKNLYQQEVVWIEKSIAKITTELDKLKNKASSTYLAWGIRNASLTSAMDKTAEAINAQQEAYDTYMQKAADVGLSQEYIDKIQNG